MATLSHSESRRSYSWLWDSHISPRNSKWLQENITDMDARVKVMIKLIEEDADSFARRAEMYYKKRPELMKLVEEFYRAYRALAERYNHAMLELHHAHRTIAKAFPDHMPLELIEDSPSKSWTPDRAPRMPDMKLPIRTLFKGEDDAQGLSRSDLRNVTPQQDDSEGNSRNWSLMQLEDLFGGDKETATKSVEGRVKKSLKPEKDKEERIHNELVQLMSENEDLKDKILQETERAGQAEIEIQGLKKSLSDMQAEKEAALQQYQQCLLKLRNLEVELGNAQKDSTRLGESSSRVEIEFQTLKEALIQLETDNDAEEAKHKEYLERISDLEAALSRQQEDNDGLNMRATKAEIESQILKDEISRLKREKDLVLHEYNLCLQKISVLQNVISVMENEVKLLKSQAENAENEVSKLQKSLSDLNVEKDASALQYQCCLETISKLEKELSSAKNDVKQLNNDVLLGNLKLKNFEEKSNLLEMSNQSLRAEADNLARKIAMKDKELSDKQEELENLQTSLQDEHLRHAQVEETLQTLQSAHSRSQDDQRSLVQELQKVLQMLKDVEVTKHGLEAEIQQVLDVNQSLNEMNQCSTVSVENKENEIFTIREIKERLEKEVSHHIDLSNSLQKEILYLKAEIEGLNGSYLTILDQIEAAGLKPECLGASVRILQDENLKLREMYEQGSSEKEALSKKLENIQVDNSRLRDMCEQGSSEKRALSNKLEDMQGILEKKVVAERSMSDLNCELESSQEKMQVLEESSQLLHGEKAALITEKACLLSQLQAMTENMHNLLEKNAVLENSLLAAKVELEGLREKAKGLEGICEFLKNERSYLLSERGTLARKLEDIERRLEDLETKYMGLEEKYADVVKEKEAVHYQVKELKASLSVEKQERTNSHIHSQTRLAGLESQIHFLKEENPWKKKEYEEEFDKSLKAQFEISVFQKIIKDMEEKNTSLIAECQKHVEASKLAEKLISQLESENLEQQVETEILLDEIERLRLSIYQVFKALEDGVDCSTENKIEHEQGFLHHILGSIDDMKGSILKHEDDQQLLLVENAVLLTLLEQLEAKGMEIESQNKYLNQEFKMMVEKIAVANNGRDKLLDLNRKLESDVNAGHQHSVTLEAELESFHLKQADLQKSYRALKDAYLQVNQENVNLTKKFSELEEEKHQMNQLTDAALLENSAIANQSVVFRSFGEEKLTELNLLLIDLSRQEEVNSCLKREVTSLTEKLEMQKAENLLLQDTVHSMEREMQVIKEFNVQMKKDIASGMENLLQTEGKLFVSGVKLEAAENLNLKLCKSIEELKTEIQESLRTRENLEHDIIHLSEKNSIQAKKIESLDSININLESEVALLHEVIEEKLIREQTLCSELQNKSNEFELWEAEAATFYFGLQITAVHEVFFENKVQELTGQCLTLRDENASKTSEVDQMKGRICSMESEIERLKSQLHAYTPVVTALRDDIAFLENNAFLQTKIKATRNDEPQISEVAASPNRDSPEIVLQDQSLISLQNLQMRIKAVGKSMQEMNKPALHRRANSVSKQETTVGELERLKPLRCLGRDKQEHSRRKGYGNEPSDTPKLQKIKTKSSEPRNATLMKDIPLDQVSDGSQNGARQRSNVRVDDKMLELWQTAPDGNRDLKIGESLRRSFKMTDKDIVYDQFDSAKHKSDPPSTDSDMEKELGVDKLEVLSRSASRNREVNTRRILERLSSDAQKLENLQITVQDLRRKLDINKKGRRPKNVNFETVEEQLLEAEETITYLVDLNGQLVKTVEECPSPDEKTSIQLKEAAKKRRRKVTEQARKGSERIGRLQLELQKIQYMLLKLEDEKKNKAKGKFFPSKTIVLRDFIYNGRKNSGKRKKGPFCGCFRQSMSQNGNSSQ